jgi:hypothetical protein
LRLPHGAAFLPQPGPRAPRAVGLRNAPFVGQTARRNCPSCFCGGGHRS